MAGVFFNLVTASNATGTSPKTVLKIVAAANHRVLVDELAIAFDGVSPSGVPITVEVLRVSNDGTLTSVTPAKFCPGDDETVQTTAGQNASVEPTPGDVLDRVFIHPQAGERWQAPEGRHYVVPGGGCLAVRVTAAVSVNCLAVAKCQE